MGGPTEGLTRKLMQGFVQSELIEDEQINNEQGRIQLERIDECDDGSMSWPRYSGGDEGDSDDVADGHGLGLEG